MKKKSWMAYFNTTHGQSQQPLPCTQLHKHCTILIVSTAAATIIVRALYTITQKPRWWNFPFFLFDFLHCWNVFVVSYVNIVFNFSFFSDFRFIICLNKKIMIMLPLCSTHKMLFSRFSSRVSLLFFCLFRFRNSNSPIREKPFV